MTALTEQWQKGELPNGIYYVELLDGDIMIAYMYKMRSCKKIVYRVKTFKGYITKNQMKAVLYKVPTYEEYQALLSDKLAKNEGVEVNAELEKDLGIAHSTCDYIFNEKEKAVNDCKTLAQKLLQVKPELRDWLEVNFKEYL